MVKRDPRENKVLAAAALFADVLFLTASNIRTTRFARFSFSARFPVAVSCPRGVGGRRPCVYRAQEKTALAAERAWLLEELQRAKDVRDRTALYCSTSLLC